MSKIALCMKKLVTVGEKIVTLTGLLLLFATIIFLYRPLANDYLTFSRPVGGDYYNGLTYAVQFSKHVPFPPSGWLSMWHEGIPIIGGYPVTAFYLMSPLFNFWEAAQVMEIFSAATLLLFFLCTALLFRALSGSSPFALLLTIIVLTNRASFYQLFAEGLVIATAMQWTLPGALYWFYKFIQTQKLKFLVLTSAISGIAVLLHPAMGVLTVVLPITLWLAVHFLKVRSFRKGFVALLTLGVLVILIGSPTLYNMVKFTLYSSGSGKCESPQCWGVYPEHFRLWLSPSVPIVLITILVILGGVKLIKKRISFAAVFEPLLASGLLWLYIIAAYFHQIGSISSSIFPRRIFWALTIFILASSAIAYRTLAKSWGKWVNITLSSLTLLLIVVLYWQQPNLLKLDTTSLFTFPGTIPANVNEFLIPKYKKQELTELLPEWVIAKSTNFQYRFDSLNFQVVNWWNVASSMPSTRGYSNSPTGPNATWLYYFQVGTGENPETLEPEIIRNRTLFLLDHYGVGLYEDSGRSGNDGQLGYSPLLLDDPNFITKHETVRELSFYDISTDIISPIVSPTNATPMLVISDEAGYETFVRALSNTGLTSREFLPVKGPANLNHLTDGQLKTFPMLFLYRFQGKNWQKLDQYVKGGGMLIIDLAAATDQQLNSLPNYFPANTFSKIEVDKQLNFKDSPSPLLQDVDTSLFAPFTYQGGPWKMWTTNTIQPDTEVVLETDQYLLLLSKTYGKGKIIVSGVNLPFHIVDNQNFEEIKLLKNILLPLVSTNKAISITIERPIPELIRVRSQSRGIYFKENYDPGWAAKTQNQKLPVYPAGTEFMYIPRSDPQEEVTLEYRGSWMSWSLFLTSLVTLFLALFLPILPHRLLKTFLSVTIPVFTLFKKPLRDIRRDEHDEY